MGLIAKVMSLPGALGGMRRADLHPDPIQQYDRWYRHACRARVFLANAVTLATATAQGRPAARMVLLKSYDGDGLLFYTNYTSRKSRELDANPYAELVVHWNELVRQVRFSGRVERTSREESAAYFHSRPRGSQVGAWASDQDSVVGHRAELIAQVKHFEAKFAGGDVPLPDDWGGYRLIPETVEFWQGRAYRLHDRFLYSRRDDDWKIARLSP